jgi:hypothetical protein
VHYIGVIFAHEHESGAPHIGRQLINLIKSTVDDVSTEIWIAKIANDKIIGFAYRVFVVFHINASNPESLRFETFY